MKSREEIMNMLEAFDLTGSLRDAGELAGVSHHTVAAYGGQARRGPAAGCWARCGGGGSSIREMAKIEEWVERSGGRIRADRCYVKLKALGFEGSDRTVRRAVAEAKKSFAAGRRRVYRPWIPEPGMWAQWDWGAGPVIAGRRTSLFCAWLAWSRFRVVIATWDRTLPTVVACVDRAMRAFGGAPTYWLTDNERTVTTDHVAGVPVRHPEIVAGRRPLWDHGGDVCCRRTPSPRAGQRRRCGSPRPTWCRPAANLRGDYTSWAELAEACDAWMAEVNGRQHRGDPAGACRDAG